MNEIVEYQSRPVVPFADAMREAEIFAHSDMVPAHFKRPENCYVAYRMAERMGVDLFMLMQNLYPVHGKVGLEAKFGIGMINSSGIFGPLNYVISGKDDDYGCQVEAVRSSDGFKVVGSRVTIGIAKAEGWYSKAGSKWKTMPEQMLRYRAAMFFARTECPQVLFGMQTRDEIQDTEPEHVTPLADTQGAIPSIPADIPEGGEVVDADFFPKSYPPLRICCNTACKSHDPNETSGCNGKLNEMRDDPKNQDNPYLYHCSIAGKDKFVQIHPAAILRPPPPLKPLPPSVISDAKAALGWDHEVEKDDVAGLWQLVYQVFGIGK